jgi:hypothetical protein
MNTECSPNGINMGVTAVAYFGKTTQTRYARIGNSNYVLKTTIDYTFGSIGAQGNVSTKDGVTLGAHAGEGITMNLKIITLEEAEKEQAKGQEKWSDAYLKTAQYNKDYNAWTSMGYSSSTAYWAAKSNQYNAEVNYLVNSVPDINYIANTSTNIFDHLRFW